MKLLTVAVPCYNSEAYMRKCIESLLPGGKEVEILIVDDGSTKDATPQIADEYAEKYPDIVTVYSIGDISHELCGGPHVKNTSELGHFKIVKEEASSSGVRRIKAILE